jgi:hypothetical protein
MREWLAKGESISHKVANIRKCFHAEHSTAFEIPNKLRPRLSLDFGVKQVGPF